MDHPASDKYNINKLRVLNPGKKHECITFQFWIIANIKSYSSHKKNEKSIITSGY